MPLTVNDIRDLTQLLAQHPEWLAEVRRLVLTEELLELPELVRALVKAQTQTETQVRTLAEAQVQLEAQVRALAEAQARTEAQVRALAEAQVQLEAQVRALAEAQVRTEARVQTLAETQQRYEERLARVEERLEELNLTTRRLVDRVGHLQGRDLERRYREQAEAYMGRWLWPVRAVSPGSLREELEARLNETEVEDVMQVDVLLQGRGRWLAERPEVWLVMEVSVVIDQVDVERAERRAALLRQAGYRAVPAVAGERLTEGAEHRVQEAPIVVVLDGYSQGWERAVQT